MLTSTVIFATGPSATPEAPAEKAWPVSVLTVAPAALAPMFGAFGKVEATRVARIQTDLVADIATVAVREGQWVNKGDVLVALDHAAFELTVREREAELGRERAVLMRVQTQWSLTKENTAHFQSKRDTAQSKLRRYQGLFEKGMVAQSLLDEVTDQASAAAIEYQTHRLALADFPNRVEEQKARVEQALSALGRAQLDLDHTTLYAPFSGPVLSVAASPGNHTALGQPLVEVADAEGLEVRVPVPDAYSAAVRRHLANGVAITARTGSDDGGMTFVLARLASNVREGHSGIDSFFRVGTPSLNALTIGRVVKLSVELPAEEGVVALTGAVALRKRPRLSGGRRSPAGADGRARRRPFDGSRRVPDSRARRRSARRRAGHHDATAESDQRVARTTGRLIPAKARRKDLGSLCKTLSVSNVFLDARVTRRTLRGRAASRSIRRLQDFAACVTTSRSTHR